MKFETTQCPLCRKVLQLRKINGVSRFCCPTTSAHHHTHYEVEFNANNSTQRMFVGDFVVDNFDTAARSRLYVQRGSMGWEMVKEVGYVRADSEANLLNRIENLMR